MIHALRVRRFTLPIFFITLLAGGCGGGGGSDSVGVAASALITPTYIGQNTKSVDAFRDSCVSDDGTIFKSEAFADHNATASITASLINPSNIIKQLTVFIDRYTIEFHNRADSPGAPPIQTAAINKSFSFIVSSDEPSSVSLELSLLDLLRKSQYITDVLNGTFPSGAGFINNYIATYTFEGHGENGAKFTFAADADFQIGSFDNCPDGFQPL